MRIFLFGKGKMGRLVERLALEKGHQIVALDQAEVAIDFSHPDALLTHIQSAMEAKIPLVMGTTGWEAHLETAQDLVSKSQGAFLFSPNFSLGMHLFIRLAREADRLFSDYERAGIEYHHSQKQDSPSGTAKALSALLNMPPFASVRCGSLPGRHTLLFESPTDAITLTHEAHNREGFALGALRAAAWMRGKQGWYILDDFISSVLCS